MKILVDVRVDYGKEKDPPWFAHYGNHYNIEVEAFNTYQCIQELAKKTSKSEKEINELMWYIQQDASAIKMWGEPGKWDKNVKDLMVQHKFTPDTPIISGDRTFDSYGIEVIRFTPLPESMKELTNISAQDASAILGL